MIILVTKPISITPVLSLARKASAKIFPVKRSLKAKANHSLKISLSYQSSYWSMSTLAVPVLLFLMPDGVNGKGKSYSPHVSLHTLPSYTSLRIKFKSRRRSDWGRCGEQCSWAPFCTGGRWETGGQWQDLWVGPARGFSTGCVPVARAGSTGPAKLCRGSGARLQISQPVVSFSEMFGFTMVFRR